jgi:hypothetical protein
MLELEESSEGEGEEGEVLLLSFLHKYTSRYSGKFIINPWFYKEIGRGTGSATI